jgi:hypothetical protein
MKGFPGMFILWSLIDARGGRNASPNEPVIARDALRARFEILPFVSGAKRQALR